MNKGKIRRLLMVAVTLLFITSCGGGKLNITGANEEQKEKIQKVLDDAKITVKKCVIASQEGGEKEDENGGYLIYDIVDTSDAKYRMTLSKKDYSVVVILNVDQQEIVYNNLASQLDGIFDGVSKEETTPSPTETPVVTKEPEQTAYTGTIHKLNDVVEIEDWEIVVKSANINQQIKEDFLSVKADEGNVFIILEMKLKNKGTDTRKFIFNERLVKVKAIYQEKYNYGMVKTLFSKDMYSLKIKPLANAEGFLAIEIPEEIVKDLNTFKLEITYQEEVNQWEINKISQEKKSTMVEKKKEKKEKKIDDYIFPDSHTRRLTEMEICTLPNELIAFARNEIYARHGRVFKNKKYADYFKQRSWYKENSNYTTDYEMLNDIERYNVEEIWSWELQTNEE